MIRAAAALHSGAPMNNPDAILNELAPAMPPNLDLMLWIVSPF